VKAAYLYGSDPLRIPAQANAMAGTWMIRASASLRQGVICRRLDRGLALANVAATEQSPFCLEAEKIYAGAKALLPKISGMDARGRGELESRVRDLRMALDIIRVGPVWSWHQRVEGRATTRGEHRQTMCPPE
jgi:hypothetical protein